LNDIFNSVLLRFGIVFMVFFAIIFFSVGKMFKGNRPVAILVSVSLAALIAGAFFQRGYLDSFYGDVIGDWAIVLGVLIGIVFLLKIVADNVGAWASIFVLVIIWAILTFTDPYVVLPYYFPEGVFIAYQLLSGITGLVALVILSILIIFFRNKKLRNKFRDYHIITR